MTLFAAFARDPLGGVVFSTPEMSDAMRKLSNAMRTLVTDPLSVHPGASFSNETLACLGDMPWSLCTGEHPVGRGKVIAVKHSFFVLTRDVILNMQPATWQLCKLAIRKPASRQNKNAKNVCIGHVWGSWL